MASYTEDSVELRKIMGKNIRERREGCGLSQSQLGKAIGSTQSYISTIENGSGRIYAEFEQRGLAALSQVRYHWNGCWCDSGG